jgi:hypothetical protein
MDATMTAENRRRLTLASFQSESGPKVASAQWSGN